MDVTNTLAYDDMATMTPIKSSIVQAPRVVFTKTTYGRSVARGAYQERSQCVLVYLCSVIAPLK
jgi:hypothetical protein